MLVYILVMSRVAAYSGSLGDLVVINVKILRWRGVVSRVRLLVAADFSGAEFSLSFTSCPAPDASR